MSSSPITHSRSRPISSTLVQTSHHLIVGRRTWQSIGRPLPGRRMIVVSRGERIYLTRIGAAVEGDVRFPDIDWGIWRLTAREEHPADEQHLHAFRFEIWDRERV